MSKTASAILSAVHETASGLHRAGVMSAQTLRSFDLTCAPPPVPLAPDEIRQIREAAHVSRVVFARLLNTSTLTVEKWETGQNKPTGTALKLLHLVQDRGLEVLV
ncbi:MAG: DNA-binding transcriptional regulator [Aquabacterium sp.]|nr:DNA-binding transcriptional regulator [Aquabacterium sp.]